MFFFYHTSIALQALQELTQVWQQRLDEKAVSLEKARADLGKVDSMN